MKVTAFVPSWKRHGNMRRIFSSLRDQTVEPRIVCVNNGEHWDSLEENCDDYWLSPFNAGPFRKFLVASNYDGWLYFNDDDILPTDNLLIASLIHTAEQTGALIVGARARTVHFDPPHYKGRGDSRGWTNNVKMGCAVMHRSALDRVRFPPSDLGIRNDDIWVSLEVSRGMMCLYADDLMRAMFEDIDQMGVGLCQQDGHYDGRERACRLWIERYHTGGLSRR